MRRSLFWTVRWSRVAWISTIGLALSSLVILGEWLSTIDPVAY